MSNNERQPEESSTGQQDVGVSAAKQVWRGRILVLTAAVLWSTSGFFAKAPGLQAWSGVEMAFWRAVFACLVLFPMVRKPQWSIWLVPMTASFAIMNYTFLTALTKLEAACAIWLQFTAPVWVFAISVLFLGEKIRARDWALLGFGVAGVGMILAFEIPASHDAIGLTCGALSGLTFACVVLSIRHLRELDPAWLIALNHLVTAIALAPLLPAGTRLPEGSEWLMFAGFGVLQMGLPYVVFAAGLKSVAGHEASCIGLLEPILVPVWVYLAWSADPTYLPPQPWTIVGGILILVGLLSRYSVGFRRAA